MPGKKDEPKKRPRRPYGTGSITKRKDGRYQGKYYVNGKACYVYGETYAECNKLLNAAVRDKKEPKSSSGSSITVVECVRLWLDRQRRIFRTNSKEQRGYTFKNHIVSAFDGIDMRNLSQAKVEAWVAQLVEKYAPRTVRNYFMLLAASCSYAVESGIIDKSPCDGIVLPKIKKTKQTILTMDQLQLLLKELEGRTIRPIVALAATMGIRKNELLALRWSDVDFTNNVIHIRRNIAREPGQFVEDDPKTVSSIRALPLMPFARKILLAQKSEQNDLILATPDWQENDLIFPNAKGGFRHSAGLDVPFKRALKRAGLPDMKFHDLRHTTASLLGHMGIHPKIVQEIMGHSSIVTTMDIYSHCFPNSHWEAMEKMNQAFLKSLELDLEEPKEEAN